jgi:predicted CXXCH cytochrome family protein
MNGRRINRVVCYLLLSGASTWGQQPQESPSEPAQDPPVAVAEPSEPKVERPTGPVDSCATAECHTKVMAGRFLHGPTAQRQCGACHVDDDVKKHTYKLVVPQSELCSYCHVQSERTFVHKPVADKQCEKCHDPHGTDHRLHLLGEPSDTLCFPCHSPDEYGSRRHIDGRMAVVGACDVCHESHSSWLPKLLPRDQDELCLVCHENLRSRLELLGGAHTPVLDGKCLDCHDAHTTEHPRQLRASTEELCYSCHEHDNIRQLVETSPFVHGALTEGASCNACHVGHGSTLPSLLAAPEKGLCLACHDGPLRMADGRVLVDIACLLKENPRHHGPIREGECTPCHASHASGHAHLLTSAYPQTTYASFSVDAYALCFECHVEKLATSEKAIGATEFRDADRNLHFLHVNKTRGRVCTTCHDVHASARPFHIRERVLFGPRKWELEINFMALPGGGTCSPGCHETTPYYRGEGVMPKAPRAGLKPEML